ncbi:MAG: ABC transporter permease [Flavobacteriales bacterium]|nr:ABC transporter permease [Flavobacteriales bacterium]MCB9449172.1 ABC transporter permease [Flavobacteriales bacterium]
MLFFRLISESALFALQALWVNKLRTFLSLLGVTIGILSIIGVLTFIDSLESNIRGSINRLGQNTIFVEKWPWTNFGPDYPWWKYFNRPVATLKESNEVRKRCQAASAVAFQASGQKTVKYRNSSVEGVSVIAVSHPAERIEAYEFSSGRYFTEIESAAGRNVIILGGAVAKGLFPFGDPLGKNIKLFGRNLKVVGVLKTEGENIFDTGNDNNVVIPINYARNITDIKSDQVNPRIMVLAKPGVSNAALMSELQGVMRSIRKIKPGEEDNFALNESNMLSQNFDGFFTTMSTVGFLIGFFSILVGGISIANIMFVSVKERTNIIGIQKALGAKSYFILIQFLLEAITLSIIGGLFGLGMVFIGTLISGALGMDVNMTVGNIVLGLVMSGTIGVLAGIIPAWSAARMDPVEAIRS